MPGQAARLELELVFDGQRTRPRRALAMPPLQISRARYDDPINPAQLDLTLIHLGGVLAGDAYALRVELDQGARAVVTAAAATQIYAMPRGHACQQLQIRAAPATTLSWLPGPQILFAGANYRQATRVELGAGASVLLAEILVPGRLARGEVWQFTSYASLIEIVDSAGTLLAAEQTLIEPARRHPATADVMARNPVVGSLWLLSDQLDAERVARLISAVGGLTSAAVLPGHCGVVMRVLGSSLATVQQALRRCYGLLASEC